MAAMSREDEVLLRRLGAAARVVDPVPELVHELGRAAYDMRLLDEELATLVQDSLTDQLAGARTLATSTRLLAFDSDGVEIDVEVQRTGRTLTLVGQMLPGPTEPDAQARLQTADGERLHAPIDDDGCFQFTGVPPVLFRLWFARAGSRPIVTGWLQP